MLERKTRFLILIIYLIIFFCLPLSFQFLSSSQFCYSKVPSFLPFYESLVLPPLKRKYRGLNFNQFGSTNFPSLAFVTVIYFLSECRIKLCSLVSSFFIILTNFKLSINRFVGEKVRTMKIRTSKTKKNIENHANHHNIEKII